MAYTVEIFRRKMGQDNPSASLDGFGNCDLAIDLGSQDSTTTVYLLRPPRFGSAPAMLRIQSAKPTHFTQSPLSGN
jgi:hypothetical protein